MIYIDDQSYRTAEKIRLAQPCPTCGHYVRPMISLHGHRAYVCGHPTGKHGERCSRTWYEWAGDCHD